MAEASGARKSRKKPNPGRKKRKATRASANPTEESYNRLFNLFKNLSGTSSGTSSGAEGTIDESGLTKGEVRKLNALRKSVGDKIADKAFAQWYRQKASAKAISPVDKNAALIASTLGPLAKAGKLKIGRGGYLVKRARERVIVSRGVGG